LRCIKIPFEAKKCLISHRVAVAVLKNDYGDGIIMVNGGVFMAEIYAHRGFTGSFPENTMIAFKEAVKIGADGIETDVHITKDGVLCLIHDETVNRTSNSKGYIRDMTWEEVKKIDVSCKVLDGRYGFCGIPSAEEFLDLIKTSGIKANIELKNGKIYYPKLADKLVDMIRSFGIEDRVMISSFNNASLVRLKKIAPEIKCGFLKGSPGVENAGLYCSEMGVDYYHPDFKTVTPEVKRECDDYGIGLNVWTVNDKPALRNMMTLGVNSVITNYPDYAIEVRNEVIK